MLKKIAWLCLCFLTTRALANDYLITDFGAKPGIVSTAAINKAVAECHAHGGGRVIVPAGIFSSGTIVLKDNVELHLQTGAT
ncbi:MAG: polygalacturonase, partial [Chitinophaga sp.]